MRRQVTGVVTMDGRPLQGATVLFRPVESGAAAFGHSNSAGRFQLLFSQNEPGILPGRYQVRVTRAGSVSDEGRFLHAETVPAAYNERSTLFQEITNETSEISLALSSTADVEERRQDRGPQRVPGPALSIMLIVADGLGPEWLGCCGGEGAATPNIDALAARGMSFRHAYAMPERAASRVTLLTGDYPFHHGWVGDWDVPRSGQGCWFDWNRYRTVASRLVEGDYLTTITGQWQLNDFRRQPDALIQHGFGRWCVWTGAEHGNPFSSRQLRDPYIYLNRPLAGVTNGWPDRNLRQYDWGGTGTFVNKLGPDVFTQFAKGTLNRRMVYQQFLYYPMTLPSSPSSEEVGASGLSTQGDRNRRHRELVEYADRMLGEIVARLESSNQRERTVIIFTSDGGSPRDVIGRRHGREVVGGRGLLTERGVQVPLIVSCPGLVAEGVETDSLVDMTDLTPTICELAGVGGQSDCDGRSFARLLQGEPLAEPRTWIMSMGAGPLEFDGERVRGRTPFAERVLRDRRFKVHVNSQREIDALYDLDADAEEAQNLIDSGDAGHLEALGRFRAVVDGFPVEDAALRYSPLSEDHGARTTALPATVDGPAS